jgi:predicted NUDIX family phosphoesterase
VFQSEIQFVKRDEAEKDSSYLQIVAGAFIRRNDRLLILKHAESEKRAKLRGKFSILVTGHVEKMDQHLTTGAKDPVENCLFRELKEELTNIDWPKVRPRFALRIGNDEMGSRHLGLIYEIESISRSLGISGLPGAGDFEPEPRFWSLNEAQDRIDEFDDWSQDILRRLERDPGT